MKKLIILLAVLMCLHQESSAQVIGDLNVLDRDLAYFNYMPPNVVSGDFNYQRFSGKVSLPPLQNGKFSLFSMVGMDVYRFNYEDNVDLGVSELDQFHNINLSVFSRYKFSDKWSLNGLLTSFILADEPPA